MDPLPSTKFHEYYRRERAAITDLLPPGNHAVMDLGCGAGATGYRLLREGKAGEMVGVEIFPPAAEEARRVYSAVHLGDLEELELPYRAHFDYVLCGDVLEHLRDPWKAIGRIGGWLKPGGCLIASIPNIRYWRVLRDLALLGRFHYVEAGILDSTHLRFFTRRSFTEMLEQGHFAVIRLQFLIGGPKQELFNRLTGGLFREFLGAQLLVSARSSGSGEDAG